ncbi:MAG TPA: hypothetical protein VIV60_16520, partial [Polyangiaceae bacterium]
PNPTISPTDSRDEAKVLTDPILDKCLRLFSFLSGFLGFVQLALALLVLLPLCLLLESIDLKPFMQLIKSRHFLLRLSMRAAWSTLRKRTINTKIPYLLYLRRFAPEKRWESVLKVEEQERFDPDRPITGGFQVEVFQVKPQPIFTALKRVANRTKIRQIVALSKGHEVLPSSIVRRIYASEASWRTRFTELVSGAHLVALYVDDVNLSPCLSWEIEALMSVNAWSKTVIVTDRRSKCQFVPPGCRDICLVDLCAS